MDEKLFQVNARCPLASQVGEIHQVSEPMRWEDAELKRLEWMAIVGRDQGWKLTIEEAETVGK